MMFVVAMKTSKKKLLSYIFLSLIFIVGLCVCMVKCASGNDTEQTSAKELTAQTNEQRIAYLKTFGWEVSQEATEIRDVVIPKSFSEVYLKYNEIQKEQGFDLSEYRGKLCSRYSYEVKNYPTKEENIKANIIVFDGLIIGGDICSQKLDGFMHGFELPRENEKPQL